MNVFRTCVALLVILLAVFLVGCKPSTNSSVMETQFKEEFGLQGVQQNFDFQEQYNSYGGIPYEGIALYSFTINQDTMLSIEAWEQLPYQANVMDFIERVSLYISFPEIRTGRWKFIPRGSTEDEIASASLCVIDTENRRGYLLMCDT